MMTAVETWLQKSGRTLKTLWSDRRFRRLGQTAAWCGGGFALSAASLMGSPQPIAMGLVCGLTGWRAAAAAVGSLLGYRVFWGGGGAQGVAWVLLGLVTALLLGPRKAGQEGPLLPAVAGLLVSGAGLGFQMLLGDETPVPVYLLRTVLAAASAWLFRGAAARREPRLDWLVQAVAVLALAQIAPVSWFNFGYVLAAALAVGGTFPAAALAGLALDLARVTQVPMTAVLCLSYLAGKIPFRNPWLRCAGPGTVYLLVMALCNLWDPLPVAALAAGGALALALPPSTAPARRRGETGMAQVRLELMAGVMTQTRQLLMEIRPGPIDREAIVLRVRERACGGCPSRKQCRDIQIPAELLTQPLTDTSVLGFPCKKPGRMVLELRRGQEQLRFLRAQREQQREIREAVIQQYYFLGEYLREQADLLPQRGQGPKPRFRAEVAFRTAGKEAANGDLCAHFPGTECRYYVMLCDGMGTGLGAAEEGQTLADMLRQMLTAGFPAEHALRSVNALMTLRGRAGAATVDLAELRLDTGRVTVYKWGAAPSWLLRPLGAEKIGTAGPPPGLSVTDTRETVERLSLRRGEALILFSDGVDAPRALRRDGVTPQAPPGELAANLLEGTGEWEDDATVAVVRLVPLSLST